MTDILAAEIIRILTLDWLCIQARYLCEKADRPVAKAARMERILKMA